MAVAVASITFDCGDAALVGRFWAAALGRPLDPGASPGFAAIGFAGRRDRSGWGPASEPTFIFTGGAGPKAGKSRVHLDVAATDVAGEVDRLVGLGATHVRDMDEWGFTWTVLHDPEGNELCVGPTRPAPGDTT